MFIASGEDFHRARRVYARVLGCLFLLFMLLGSGVLPAAAQDPGSFIDAFVSAGNGEPDGPEGLVFGPDGHLYVSSFGTDAVLRYDGTTGSFIDAFVPSDVSILTTSPFSKR